MNTNNNLRPCVVRRGHALQKAFFHRWVMCTDPHDPKGKSQRAYALVELNNGDVVTLPHVFITFVDTKELMERADWPEKIHGEVVQE